MRHPKYKKIITNPTASLIALLLVLGVATSGQVASSPLSYERMKGYCSALSVFELITTIRHKGVHFRLTDKMKSELAEIGCGKNEEVLQAIARNYQLIGWVPTEEKGFLRLCGSKTIGYELAPTLARVFLEEEEQAKEVETEWKDEHLLVVTGYKSGNPVAIPIVGTNSRGGFTALWQDECDVAMASRKIREDEHRRFLGLNKGDLHAPAYEHPFATDRITIIVNRRNPLRQLTREKLAQILSGQKKNWGNLRFRGSDKIIVYTRGPGSGTRHKLMAMLDIPAIPSQNIVSSHTQMSKLISDDLTGIGYVPGPYVGNAKKVLVLNGGEKSAPFGRELFLYITENHSQAADSFVRFVKGKRAQAIVKHYGFGPLFAVEGSEGFEEYREETEDAIKIGELHFSCGSHKIDEAAAAELIEKIRKLGDLMVFGFTNDIELVGHSMELARKRAETVAAWIEKNVKKNVAVAHGVGIGLHGNDMPEGRARNRRVELWQRYY